MKKFLGSITVAAALLVAAFPLVSRADTFAPAYPETQLWDSGVVGTVAAASPIMDTSAFKTLKVLVDNTSGTASRVVTVSCHTSVGTSQQLYAFDAVTVTTAQPAVIVLDPILQSATNKPTGGTYYSTRPCPRTKVSAAAANGQVRFTVSGEKIVR